MERPIVQTLDDSFHDLGFLHFGFLWEWFIKRTPVEMQVDTAKHLLTLGEYALADKEYRFLVGSLPNDVGVYLGLA